jgi:hypothetical protein
MSSSDTQSIDDKKNSTSSETNDMVKNVGKFFISVLALVAFIISYFFIGSLVLYSCKVGQSNILPTDEKCFPYTDNIPIIESIQTNIFTTMFTDPQLSLKLKIPYDKDNSKNMVLDILRNYKHDTHSYFLLNYFISIIEALLALNFTSSNAALNGFNMLPEPLIILLGPIAIPTIATLIIIVNIFYGMYLWFAKMSWFFKKNVNEIKGHRPVWEDISLLEPFNYFCAVWLVILFVILFFVVGIASSPVLPMISMVWCIITCIGYKGVIDNKQVTLMGILSDVLKYYKIPLMSVISMFVVMSAFATLGPVPGLFSLFVLALIYWGIIPINIFKPIIEENLSPLVKNIQAKKKCEVSEGPSQKAKHHGFIYNFVNFFVPLSSQSGGKNFVKELKSIGKKIQG